MHQMMKYLIINADDFGYCPRRDRAILDLFRKHCISSTSLLVNGVNVQQACAEAKLMDLPMGIHLNLTEGRPITNDCNRIQSLVNSQGLMHGKIGLREELERGNVHVEHMEYEIRMQLNRYKELMQGENPRHIDGHQHIHVHPMVVEIVGRIAREFAIEYIRAPNDRMIDVCNIFYRDIVNQTRLAMKIFDRYSLIYADYFFGMNIMGEKFTLENIEQCLQSIEEKKKEDILIEFMCHPGYLSDPLIGGCGTGQPDEFSQSKDRQIEYEILASTELKNLFDKYQFQLGIYENFVNKDRLDDDEVNVDANHYE